MSQLETILKIKVDGTDSMVKLKDTIDSTNEELKELKESQKAAGADGKKFNAEILTTETRLKAMKKELVGAKNDTIKMNASLNAGTKSYNDLTKQNAAYSTQLRKLADPMGKNKKQFDELSKKMNTNTESLKKMDAQMGRQQRNVGNYGGALKTMGLQLGAAVLAFKTLERVISTFTDFQFAIKQVGVISGATATELKALEDQAKELGATTAFTANEVANLQIELAKLGFDSKDINNMTSSVLDLSFAFGDDLGTTAEQVGITLRAFNLDASEASRVTDVMAAAFSNTALDLEKFATAMPKVASIASTMGFTLEDTTSILGMLANTGMEASTAGTSLKNIFLKLADPTGDLAQALGRNVKSVDDLIPAMKELTAKGIDVAGMLEITDRRSVTAFASLLKGADKLKILNTTLKNSQGLTQKFADVMRDSLKGQIDAAKSAAEGLVLELVDGLEPILNMVIYAFTELLGVLRFLAPVITSLAAGMATYGVTLLATKGFTLLLSGANAVLTGTTTVLATVTGLAKKAMDLFNLAVKANPIGLLVAGLVTAVSLFKAFSGEAEESSEELKSLNDERERFNKIDQQATTDTNKQLGAAKELIAVIGNQAKSMDERNKALKTLNAIHPTTIKNLSDEKNLASQLVTAYEDVSKAIKAEIVLSASREKIKGLLTEQAGLEQEVTKAVDEQIKMKLKLLGVENEISASGEIIGEVWDESSESYVNGVKAIEFVNENWMESSNRLRIVQIQGDEENQKHNDLVLELGESQRESSKATASAGDIQTQVNTIMAQANSYVESLNLALEDNTSNLDDNKTAYEKLKSAVSDATKDLQQAIITNIGVKEATDKLALAKKNLAAVDTKVKNIIKENDDELKDSNAGLQAKIDKQNELIAAEQLQLASIDRISQAGANLAKEQIEQALAVAQAQLDLYLMQINMSGESAKVQAENINKIKIKIAGFNESLKGMSDGNKKNSPSGWLNDNLFGTGGEDGAGGEAFTGADMLNSISATLGGVMDVMSSYNELQNEQLNTQLQTMTQAKNDEIKLFKESAEYEIMTDEQKALRITAIEKKHDDAMLKLKVEQFEKNKAFNIAQAIMGGAMAVMQIWSSSATGNAIADSIIKSIMTAAMIGVTSMNIATIKSQAPPTAELGGVMDDSFFATGGMVNGKSHAQGGEKFKVGGRVVELEGGEAVINKRSTAMFKPQLSQMNVAGGGRKFADGGMTFATDMLETESLAMSNALGNQEDVQVVMVEADVTDSQRSVENIEAQATF
tara:strand:+ start:13865 stop:17650 length:3786 start_codon:yes stop_codon:yes gene_type:complete